MRLHRYTHQYNGRIVITKQQTTKEIESGASLQQQCCSIGTQTTGQGGGWLLLWLRDLLALLLYIERVY